MWVWMVLDCCSLCLWAVTKKVLFDTTIGSFFFFLSAGQPDVSWYTSLSGSASGSASCGTESRGKRQSSCVRAIQQIPLHYFKPKYVQAFHTSFIKCCGFGCLYTVEVSVRDPREEDLRIKKQGLEVRVPRQKDGQLGNFKTDATSHLWQCILYLL